jgi:hypothetical protein
MSSEYVAKRIERDSLTKRDPIPRAVVVSAGSKKLYRVDASGASRVYDLVDEVSLTVFGRQHLHVVTPASRDWKFGKPDIDGNRGHSSIRS